MNWMAATYSKPSYGDLPNLGKQTLNGHSKTAELSHEKGSDPTPFYANDIWIESIELLSQ